MLRFFLSLTSLKVDILMCNSLITWFFNISMCFLYIKVLYRDWTFILYFYFSNFFNYRAGCCSSIIQSWTKKTHQKQKRTEVTTTEAKGTYLIDIHTLFHVFLSFVTYSMVSEESKFSSWQVSNNDRDTASRTQSCSLTL